MKTKLLAISTMALSLASCASQHAIDMSKDTLQMEVSSSAPDNRADAVKNGADSIPQQVLDRGYDLYQILDIHSDTVGSTFGAGVDTMNLDLVSKTITSVGGLAIATLHSGEASLKVKMYHYGEKGSDDALDAKEQLSKIKK